MIDEWEGRQDPVTSCLVRRGKDEVGRRRRREEEQQQQQDRNLGREDQSRLGRGRHAGLE